MADFRMTLIINLLRRRLRDGDMNTYAIESQFYAKELKMNVEHLRQMACESLDRIDPYKKEK